MPIELTDDIRDALASAAENRSASVYATINEQGFPNLSYRGSMMVFDHEHLAYWDYALRGAIAHVAANPKVGVLVRDPVSRTTWRFFGEAILHPEGVVREQVMARTIARELEHDPERKGIAVLIRVECVMDGAGKILMER